ncbi:glycosyltransferase family 2 protein [Gordonia soli]|uniref:4,4'-diaponeurosporenoate glycosyltransferase n=1 Tax=Gordonia soli NBRC 108243 TaxID=1223545 RepID=M0QNA5_9ACTN|nr:glycosyltransferase family 2 protein [Gordonia soli]GAC69771.1 putative glycosyltransferase [Gordonia soli NBRC 108243]
MTGLSVVIPAYDEGEVIGGCLERLTAQSEYLHEVIVVDNNSRDDTVAVVETFASRLPGLRVITEAQQGLVYARNAGMDAATGGLIARIDADTHVGERWAQTVVDFFAADHDGRWSALCGRGEAYGVPMSGRWERLKVRLHPLGRRRSPTAVTEVPVLYGSNMILRSSTWQAIRGRAALRRDVFEDVDMGLCVQDVGGRNAFLGDLTVGVSPRRMHTGMRGFVTYMSALPRTFLLHRRIGLAIGAAAVYLPAIIVVHAARLAVMRVYDAETGGFRASGSARPAADRVLP